MLHQIQWSFGLQHKSEKTITNYGELVKENETSGRERIQSTLTLKRKISKRHLERAISMIANANSLLSIAQMATNVSLSRSRYNKSGTSIKSDQVS